MLKIKFYVEKNILRLLKSLISNFLIISREENSFSQIKSGIEVLENILKFTKKQVSIDVILKKIKIESLSKTEVEHFRYLYDKLGKKNNYYYLENSIDICCMELIDIYVSNIIQMINDSDFSTEDIYIETYHIHNVVGIILENNIKNKEAKLKYYIDLEIEGYKKQSHLVYFERYKYIWNKITKIIEKMN